MKTFDYARAWQENARPAFESLPANVRALVGRVAVEAGELHQLADCSMPWPEESDLRATFEKIPAEWLALAASVVYYAGHWFPSWGKLDGLPRDGATWKFSHYADQSLRARLGRPERGPGRFNTPGVTYQIHQGAIRVCWSSRDCWTWREVAPATERGLLRAQEAAQAIHDAVGKFPERQRHERDNAAYSAMEGIDKLAGFLADPSPWWPRLMDTDRYMVEDGDQMPPPPDPEADARRAAKKRAQVIERAERDIRKATTQRDGYLWLLDRGIAIDNVIYYDHTDLWSFGWRQPVGPVFLAQILDVISEFGRAYQIKTADGRTLEGNR